MVVNINQIKLKQKRGNGVSNLIALCRINTLYTTGKELQNEKKVPGVLSKPNNYLTNRITQPTNRITITKPNNYDDIYKEPQEIKQ